MTTTHTYPPETSEGPKRKTPIFSMDDIAASASKENPELFGSASVGGQASRRETYNHSSFTARQSNPYGTPNPFGTPPPNELPRHRRTGIFDGYWENLDPHTPSTSTDIQWGATGRPQNLTIPEAKLIPLLTLQTDTTKVTKMTTPKQAVQTNPEDPEARAAPVGLEVLEIPADLATTPPTSKTSCGNS